MYTLYAITVNHHIAPVSIREQFALVNNSTKDFLSRLRDVVGIKEAMVVSTCNRTEVYFGADEDRNREVRDYLAVYNGVSTENSKSCFKLLAGNVAIKHLFRLAIGLDSQVLGDIQIYSQVKLAYQQSVESDMAGVLLHRLLHTVFHCHKRVHQETSFKDGAASIAFNAVKLINQNCFYGRNARVLVSGIGALGKSVCRNLFKQGYYEVDVTNRNEEKAIELAGECQYKIVEFDSHKERLSEYDIVISSLSVPGFYHIMDFTPGTIVIDLGSPRTVLGEGPAKIFNIDQIGSMTTETLQNRENEIPKIEKIIDECQEEFLNWKKEQLMMTHIQQFKEVLEEVRSNTLAQYGSKLDALQRNLLEKSTASMINKIVQLPVLQLKSACKRGEAEALTGPLMTLFNIENNSTNHLTKTRQ